MNIKKEIVTLIISAKDNKYLNIVLNNFFKMNNFSLKEKAFITEIFYGVERNKIFIDYMLSKIAKKIKKDWIKVLLEVSIYQITFMKSDNKGAVWEASEIAKKKYGDVVSKFVNAALRNYLKIYEEEIENLKVKKNYETLYSIPNWFYEILKNEYPLNVEEVIKSYKKIPYISIRINKLKYSENEFENLLAKEEIKIIKKVDSVYYLDSGKIINTSEFKEGKIIVQDASSYIAAKNLDPKEDEIVLDICAAPGGKTAVLAENMNNKGEILALDIYKHKIKLIEENMKKLEIKNVKTVLLDGRNINKQGKKFDKILIDAPCSGYGVLRKKPEILSNKNLNKIDELPNLQFELLNAAADVLKIGGSLVYSTCTILKNENTKNIEKFLKNRKDFIVEKLYIPENILGEYDEFGGFLVNYKEEIADGFYIIKLNRVENNA